MIHHWVTDQHEIQFMSFHEVLLHVCICVAVLSIGCCQIAEQTVLFENAFCHDITVVKDWKGGMKRLIYKDKNGQLMLTVDRCFGSDYEEIEFKDAKNKRMDKVTIKDGSVDCIVPSALKMSNKWDSKGKIYTWQYGSGQYSNKVILLYSITYKRLANKIAFYGPKGKLLSTK